MCRSGPHTRRLDLTAHQRGIEHRTIGDASLVERRIGPDDEITHQGVHAIRPDHGIGLRRRAVGKRQGHLVGRLIEPDQLLVEIDNPGRQHGIQRFVQIGAMHAHERRAVQALGHRQFALDLAGVPDPIEMGIGLEGNVAQLLLHANAAQDARRIRQHLDASADAHELVRLLIDVHLDAGLAQRRGCCESAHARADNGDRKLLLCHRRRFPVVSAALSCQAGLAKEWSRRTNHASPRKTGTVFPRDWSKRRNGVCRTLRAPYESSAL